MGIHITQESSGRPAMTGVVLKRNLISDNRRFGINFYDGAYSASGGSGTMRSEFDTIWDNGIGIMVSRATSNKTIVHATIHGNDDEGIKIGEAGKTGGQGDHHRDAHQQQPGLRHLAGDRQLGHGQVHRVWRRTPSARSRAARARRRSTPSPRATRPRPPSNSKFLYIQPSSYQFTAGPTGGPIGARYGGYGLVDGGTSRQTDSRP